MESWPRPGFSVMALYASTRMKRLVFHVDFIRLFAGVIHCAGKATYLRKLGATDRAKFYLVATKPATQTEGRHLAVIPAYRQAG